MVNTYFLHMVQEHTLHGTIYINNKIYGNLCKISIKHFIYNHLFVVFCFHFINLDNSFLIFLFFVLFGLDF